MDSSVDPVPGHRAQALRASSWVKRAVEAVPLPRPRAEEEASALRTVRSCRPRAPGARFVGSVIS